MNIFNFLYLQDDDGLPGAPLPPLLQEVELYPSQELDPNFPIIKRGEVLTTHKSTDHSHTTEQNHTLGLQTRQKFTTGPFSDSDTYFGSCSGHWTWNWTFLRYQIKFYFFPNTPSNSAPVILQNQEEFSWMTFVDI